MLKSLIPWKRRSEQLPVQHNEPTRWDATEPLSMTRIRDEMDRLMNRLFDDRFMGDLASPWEGSPWNRGWDMGWQDEGYEFVFRAELPGFESSDFDVKMTDNMLTIRAEHKDEQQNKTGAHYRYGSFVRTMSLPHGADVAQVGARYHSGVLEIHVPKSEEAQSRRIEVRSGKETEA